MPRVVIPIHNVDADALLQLEYALAFVDLDVIFSRVNRDASTVEVDVTHEGSVSSVTAKVEGLVRRYERGRYGLAKLVQYERQGPLVPTDAWSALVEQKWVVPVGEGHVILRGPAARLVQAIDARVSRTFAAEFGAEREYYPSTIRCQTLDRARHFTSFPEHIDFVAHLKADLDTLSAFSDACRKDGWRSEAHYDRMADHELALSPSCCYHCYEGMEGASIDAPGRSVTAILECHRYEGRNHRTLSRLRAFTMREVVWVGRPEYVIRSRRRAEELIVAWADEWELSARFETANDMFFTDDYAIKASFQRQQQAKRELRLFVPHEDQWISVFSSNFHGTTFGKAFYIGVDGRPATSGCIGWGYERWVYAVFSQFGLDPARWPTRLREEYAAIS